MAPTLMAPTTSMVGQLVSLAALHDQGALSDEEFVAAKNKVLSITTTPGGQAQGGTSSGVQMNVLVFVSCCCLIECYIENHRGRHNHSC